VAGCGDVDHQSGVRAGALPQGRLRLRADAAAGRGAAFVLAAGGAGRARQPPAVAGAAGRLRVGRAGAGRAGTGVPARRVGRPRGGAGHRRDRRAQGGRPDGGGGGAVRRYHRAGGELPDGGVPGLCDRAGARVDGLRVVPAQDVGRRCRPAGAGAGARPGRVRDQAAAGHRPDPPRGGRIGAVRLDRGRRSLRPRRPATRLCGILGQGVRVHRADQLRRDLRRWCPHRHHPGPAGAGRRVVAAFLRTWLQGPPLV
jgi:hypothetical protein